MIGWCVLLEHGIDTACPARARATPPGGPGCAAMSFAKADLGVEAPPLASYDPIVRKAVW